MELVPCPVGHAHSSAALTVSFPKGPQQTEKCKLPHFVLPASWKSEVCYLEHVWTFSYSIARVNHLQIVLECGFWGSNLGNSGSARWPLWTPSGNTKIVPDLENAILMLPAKFGVPTRSPKCPTDPHTELSWGHPSAPPP